MTEFIKAEALSHKAEEALHAAVNSPNGFLCVVEGAIPTKDNGIYGMVGGRTYDEQWPERARNSLW